MTTRLTSTAPGATRRRCRRTIVLSALVGCTAALSLSAPAHAVGGYHTNSSVRVRAAATTHSDQITMIGSAGTAVDIACQVTGETVTISGYSSAIWDKLNGYNGYVTDLAVEETRYAQFDPRIPRCDAPAVPTGNRAHGNTEPNNSGAAGQCTWGAKTLFQQATGVFPALYGNAKDWAGSARAGGWTTVDDAESRSIVVFQPGVQGADRNYGHVAWVDSVERRNDGLYVHLTEMNGAAGPNHWSTRVVKDVVGMSYILAP